MQRHIPKSFDVDRDLTVATFTEGLLALGYRKVELPAAGESPAVRCSFWIEANHTVTVVDNAGAEIEAGDFGEGWEIDGESVESLRDALAMFEVDSDVLLRPDDFRTPDEIAGSIAYYGIGSKWTMADFRPTSRLPADAPVEDGADGTSLEHHPKKSQ